MGSNCYGFSIPIEVCVNGAVGEGDTATLTAGSSGGSFVSPGIFKTIKNWDGSKVTITGWASGAAFGCQVLSSELTVMLDKNVKNQVNVSMKLVVGNCNTGSFYSSCGGPGPHTFEESTSFKIIGGSGCSL